MRLRWALLLLGVMGCGSEAIVSQSPAVQVVPGPGLPAEIVPQIANNNLDVVRHDGRIYFAFRSAPTHFASVDAVLWVVSSTDEQTWRFEARFELDRDLREPRFLSWNGKLFLYFAVLGESVFDFEPKEMRVSERLADGSWTPSEPFYQPGFIPWRTRVVGGTPYLVTYVGGENIYDVDGQPLEIHFLTTQDGRNWVPVVPGQPAVLTGGGSETDFAILDDGSLVAIVRNEAGDASGWGSKICRAPASALGTWTCVHDPRKFDSPLVFRHGPDVFLIARRNLTETGNYDLGMRDLTPQQQTNKYLADYSSRPKRCAIWKVDPESSSVSFVADLPSRGDTCFPGVIEGDSPDEVFLYNYSSDPFGENDPAWLAGQLGPTQIYRQVLRFPTP